MSELLQSVERVLNTERARLPGKNEKNPLLFTAVCMSIINSRGVRRMWGDRRQEKTK